MSDLNYSLGIDIGSTTVKVALLGAEGKILFSDYERHFANIQSTLASLIEKAVNSLRKDISILLSPALADFPWGRISAFRLCRRWSRWQPP